MIKTIVLIFFAYVLGSIPTALIIGKIFKGIDIREHGSKNVGSTNAARVLGVKFGIATLILDVLKGALPTYLASRLVADYLTSITSLKGLDIIVVGFFAIIGHSFSIFLNFKGGKSVATTVGVFLVLSPVGILIEAIIFLIIFYLSKYISLASIICALLLPFIMFFTTGHNMLYTIVGLIIGLLIVLRHKSNIERLRNGTENKFKI